MLNDGAYVKKKITTNYKNNANFFFLNLYNFFSSFVYFSLKIMSVFNVWYLCWLPLLKPGSESFYLSLLFFKLWEKENDNECIKCIKLM